MFGTRVQAPLVVPLFRLIVLFLLNGVLVMDWFSIRKKHTLVSLDAALTGREQEMQLVEPHRLFGCELRRPLPAGEQRLYLGMGCFWGAERRLWQQPGVTLTAVGYGGGFTTNAT